MESLKYIYHLPFSQRSEFCKIMNQNDKWEELAGKSSESPSTYKIYIYLTLLLLLLVFFLFLHIKLHFTLSLSIVYATFILFLIISCDKLSMRGKSMYFIKLEFFSYYYNIDRYLDEV